MTKLFYIVLIFTFSIHFVYAQDARELSKKASDAVRFESMEMISTLKIQNAKGDERIRQISTATKKFEKTSKTILKFTAPADVKGTSLLIFDHETENDDLWIYMPALRKTRRIVSSERGKNFMGSEFTNADMSMPNLDDFEYQLLGEETVEGKLCWKIESLCKDEDIEDEYGISKKISYIEKENSLVFKVEYFDLDGDLNRIQRLKDYRKQTNGKYFAFYMEMENVQNGRRSVMNIDKFQLGSTLSEEVFSPSMLER